MWQPKFGLRPNSLLSFPHKLNPSISHYLCLKINSIVGSTELKQSKSLKNHIGSEPKLIKWDVLQLPFLPFMSNFLAGVPSFLTSPIILKLYQMCTNSPLKFSFSYRIIRLIWVKVKLRFKKLEKTLYLKNNSLIIIVLLNIQENYLNSRA